MSSLNLADFTMNTRASFVKVMRPLIENPIKLAVVIVVIILLIYMYANDQENPKIKIIFWAFLVITPILFLHDKLVSDSVKETQQTNMESFIGGLGGLGNFGVGNFNQNGTSDRQMLGPMNVAPANAFRVNGSMEPRKPTLPNLTSAMSENRVAPPNQD